MYSWQYNVITFFLFCCAEPSLRQRFLFRLLRFAAKVCIAQYQEHFSILYTMSKILHFVCINVQHVELSVSKLEVSVHDVVDKEVEFLGVVMVREGVSLLAQPMPDK